MVKPLLYLSAAGKTVAVFLQILQKNTLLLEFFILFLEWGQSSLFYNTFVLTQCGSLILDFLGLN